MKITTLCVVQNYGFMGAQESPLLTLDELAAHARELKRDTSSASHLNPPPCLGAVS